LRRLFGDDNRGRFGKRPSGVVRIKPTPAMTFIMTGLSLTAGDLFPMSLVSKVDNRH